MPHISTARRVARGHSAVTKERRILELRNFLAEGEDQSVHRTRVRAEGWRGGGIDGEPGHEVPAYAPLLVAGPLHLAALQLARRLHAPKLRCRILAEAANGPTTNGADRVLETREEIEVIPDVLCNSGGVIVSYFEWLQNLQNYYWTRDEVLAKLYAILDKAKASVEYQKRKMKFSRRLAALTLGIQRVADAKQKRGLFP